MLSWLAGKMIARNMRSMRAGDTAPTLAMDADDVRFTFPGDSSFAGDHRVIVTGDMAPEHPLVAAPADASGMDMRLNVYAQRAA